MNTTCVAICMAVCLADLLPSQGGSPPHHDAAPGAPGTLRLTTDRAVVFKDGHALLVKTARGTIAADGTLATDQVPDAAVLGSFWATCAGTPIQAMRAEWVEQRTTREREVPCTSVRDLLVANAGRGLVLTLQWPEERQLQCKVVRVLEAEPPPDAPRTTSDTAAAQPWSAPASHRSFVPLPQPSAVTAPPVAGTEITAVTPIGGTWVELELPGATPGAEPQQAIVPVADVRSVSGTGLRTTCMRKEVVVERQKRLAFDFGADAAGKEVAVSLLYFTPGLRWIPTYRLGGDLETSGRLALQAEILNELEDLDGAVVDLVVGVPSFRFGDTISPLSLEQTMRNVLQQAAPQLMGGSNALSNALFTQRSGEQMRPSPASGGGSAGALAVAGELAATGEQDMFVHSLPRLRLARGARATVPLWSSEPTLRHLYTFDVRPVRESAGRVLLASNADRADASPLELAQNRVWHQLELDNKTQVPWTTGPALVLKGTLPLGQDLLTYTPPGSSTLLPLTVAVNVRGEYEERQTSSRPNALVWNGSSYTRVTKQGIVRVRNHERQAVQMRVRVALGGKVLTADGDGAIVLREHDPADWRGAVHDLRPNGHSDVTWNLRLEPGTERELSFEVELFLR